MQVSVCGALKLDNKLTIKISLLREEEIVQFVDILG